MATSGSTAAGVAVLAVEVVAAAVAVAMVQRGIFRHRPGHRRPWLLIAAALAAYGAGTACSIAGGLLGLGALAVVAHLGSVVAVVLGWPARRR